MEMIDYIYRFDPKHPSAKPVPRDAEAAKRMLESGNQMFAEWMESCQKSESRNVGETRYIVQCNSNEVGIWRTREQLPKHAPFAVLVGCSDARVPAEMIFGLGFNNLFVVRVAGNVLGEECLGSVDFALSALSESVRIVLMLGHSDCGAVTGAVDAYLGPLKYWSKSTSIHLRSILRLIFVSVREADSVIKEAWGTDARSIPGYREALIDVAVALNAAHAAADLRIEVERAGKQGIEVLYGVYNTRTHRVSTPFDTTGQGDTSESHLAYVPKWNPKRSSPLAAIACLRSSPRHRAELSSKWDATRTDQRRARAGGRIDGLNRLGFVF